MLSENPYDTFFSKMGYIFIKFGSEWHRTAVNVSNINTPLQTRLSRFSLFLFLKKPCLSANPINTC